MDCFENMILSKGSSYNNRPFTVFFGDAGNVFIFRLLCSFALSECCYLLLMYFKCVIWAHLCPVTYPKTPLIRHNGHLFILERCHWRETGDTDLSFSFSVSFTEHIFCTTVSENGLKLLGTSFFRKPQNVCTLVYY